MLKFVSLIPCLPFFKFTSSFWQSIHSRCLLRKEDWGIFSFCNSYRWLLDLETVPLRFPLVLLFSIFLSFCFTSWKSFSTLISQTTVEFFFLCLLPESFNSSFLFTQLTVNSIVHSSDSCSLSIDCFIFMVSHIWFYRSNLYFYLCILIIVFYFQWYPK